MRQTTALFTCIALALVSTASRSAELSGTWKVVAQDGPTPLCNVMHGGWCAEFPKLPRRPLPNRNGRRRRFRQPRSASSNCL